MALCNRSLSAGYARLTSISAHEVLHNNSSIFIRVLGDTPVRISNAHRNFSTQKPVSSRKAVTVINDDGRVGWKDLSAGEKAARTTQQSFNLLLVLAGVVMTGGVATLLYLEVFSTDSKTSHFNRAVGRVRSDDQCQQVLGDGKKIRAFGEASWNKWTRNRPIASRTEKDKIGNEHLYLHFNVEGPLNSGVVNLHMVRRPSEHEYEYRYLSLDVKNHQRIYLENADAEKGDKRATGKLFGVRWW
ncbi:TIM21-domain-containing protein [Aulographum hederae CBS 113979]|uniref:Mitochondrial import inner membrane translocase subunit Tim21 n=1 Tax=Aulographum hederae CBS 113979 TaxID=1176131 RepID=A0A6G1H311_9PEZI|nr:TIM21-domain-containing protein [Aulographum hederae CBS 113979]